VIIMRALQFADFGSNLESSLDRSARSQARFKDCDRQDRRRRDQPSDVRNVEGKMEGTSLPRVPGRDYAGTVIHGPAEWIGAEVWGTGGEIGYSIDGSHAELIAVPTASLRRKPKTLSMEQAAAIGVTYFAAWLGLVEYAQLAAGETLLVTGAGGGVGGAVAQIGKWREARVIGVDRRPLPKDSPAADSVDDFIVLGDEPLKTVVHCLTNGRGADVVLMPSAVPCSSHRSRLWRIADDSSRSLRWAIAVSASTFSTSTTMKVGCSVSIRAIAMPSPRRRCSTRSRPSSNRVRSRRLGLTEPFPSRTDRPPMSRLPKEQGGLGLALS